MTDSAQRRLCRFFITGEKYETEYVLSYDIAGKIEAYPLEEGDRVTTHLSIDANGNVTRTEYVSNSVYKN